MSGARTRLREWKTAYWERVHARPIRCELERAAFSFTFDDAPRSLLEHALPLLESVDAAATLYLAAGLADPATGPEAAEFISLGEAAEVHGRGHQIGCHTYSHLDLGRTPWAQVEPDTRRNRELLSEAIGGAAIEDFAYPFGGVSRAAKRGLGPTYGSLRSNRGGVNVGRVDLAFLRAESIYSGSLDRAGLERRIEEAVDRGGWLIFYTHGVEPEPDVYGTSPADLAWLIECCRAAAGEIETVASVRARLAAAR